MNDYQCNVGYLLVAATCYLSLVIGCVVMSFEQRLAGAILLVLRTPNLHLAHTQIVTIILFQFFQAAFRYGGQFMFRFSRTLSIAIALHDVLLARAGRLLHLVYSAVVGSVEEMVYEVDGDVENAFSFLERQKGPIAVNLFAVFVHND